MDLESCKVAVIMSVYRNDRFDYLQESVESIINQSHKNIVFYIYRDGDVPVEVNSYLNDLSAISDNIIYIESKENLGLAAALNKLIDVVVIDGSFDYIARMDSDDRSHKLRIEKQIKFLEENRHIDVCGTSCKEFGASFALTEKHLPKTPEELINFSIGRCPFIHPSVIFRTSVFNNELRYPTNTALTEDMALWFILLNRNFKFANINEILMDYRLTEDTLERRSGIAKAFSEFIIRSKNMYKLKKINFKNIVLVMTRLIFHLLPSYLLKIAYKRMR